MKTKIILCFLPFVIPLLVHFKDYRQSVVGPHGGITKPSQNYIIETKTEFPYVYSYLLDRNNNPIKNDKISCEICFFLPDNTSLDVQSKPIGSDAFSVESGILIYNSFRVTFQIFGKFESAIFESEKVIVKKK